MGTVRLFTSDGSIVERSIVYRRGVFAVVAMACEVCCCVVHTPSGIMMHAPCDLHGYSSDDAIQLCRAYAEHDPEHGSDLAFGVPPSAAVLMPIYQSFVADRELGSCPGNGCGRGRWIIHYPVKQERPKDEQ